jgi:hypothetical protein
MATMTINVNNETERVFRSKVYRAYGRRKGSLGRAITEAMKEWVMKKECLDNCMNFLETGINMGKINYSERDELHDRH